MTHLECLCVRHSDSIVDEVEIHGSRNIIFADTLDFEGFRVAELSILEVFVKDRTDGVSHHHLDFPAASLLEIPGRPTEGPTRRPRSDEVRDSSLCLTPYLGSQGLVVRQRIQDVVVLVHTEVVRVAIAKSLLHVHVVFGIARFQSSRSDDELRAIGPDRIHFLTRALWTGNDDGLITLHCSHHCSCRTRVPRRGGNNCHSWLEQSLSLSFVNDVLSNTVLDAVAGVHEFTLR
mmetsp:Transcript_9596/g.18819  ORF Transcript_9596/g.18819 Transcript_9596/m.18819 type:complete len:233 (-) Transcript_9596:698-1396(-)